MSFLQNPWVVGILGGIISGIAVFYITQFIFKRKDNSKYLEQINMANDEVIRLLKPYVAEKGLPDLDIISALVASIARKYSIAVNEIYSIRVICEELIKEIIENVYVSSEKKAEYLKDLNDYLTNFETKIDDEEIFIDLKQQLEQLNMKSKQEFKNKYIRLMSLILALFTTAASIVLPVLSNMFKDNPLFNNEMTLFPTNSFLPLSIVSIAFMATMIFLVFIMMMQKTKLPHIKNTNQKEKNINQNDINNV